MKTLAALLLSLVMAVTPACASMPKQVMTTTHRIEMRVTALDDAGLPQETGDICSATAIGPHALLTATHCDLKASVVGVDGVAAAIVDRIADGNDHTIYIVNITFSNWAQFEMGKTAPGDEVWLRGNPDGLTQLVRHGIYSGAIAEKIDGVARIIFMFDINGWHGDSGSAIFDKHGKIIAVTSIGVDDGGWNMLGTFPINFTKAQLDKAGK